MSTSGRERGWRRDEQGVSEVVGYILGILTAFLLLVATVYAFRQVSDNSARLGAVAELRDIANRVALAVQETLAVANNRQLTASDTNTTVLRYNRSLPVVYDIKGWTYQVKVDPSYVNASVTRPVYVNVSVPTFNAAVIVSGAGASCTTSSLLCELTGTALSGRGEIVVSYQYTYVSPPGSPTNRVSIE